MMQHELLFMFKIYGQPKEFKFKFDPNGMKRRTKDIEYLDSVKKFSEDIYEYGKNIEPGITKLETMLNIILNKIIDWSPESEKFIFTFITPIIYHLYPKLVGMSIIAQLDGRKALFAVEGEKYIKAWNEYNQKERVKDIAKNYFSDNFVKPSVQKNPTATNMQLFDLNGLNEILDRVPK